MAPLLACHPHTHTLYSLSLSPLCSRTRWLRTRLPGVRHGTRSASRGAGVASAPASPGGDPGGGGGGTASASSSSSSRTPSNRLSRGAGAGADGGGANAASPRGEGGGAGAPRAATATNWDVDIGGGVWLRPAASPEESKRRQKSECAFFTFLTTAVCVCDPLPRPRAPDTHATLAAKQTKIVCVWFVS